MAANFCDLGMPRWARTVSKTGPPGLGSGLKVECMTQIQNFFLFLNLCHHFFLNMYFFFPFFFLFSFLFFFFVDEGGELADIPGGFLRQAWRCGHLPGGGAVHKGAASWPGWAQ